MARSVGYHGTPRCGRCQLPPRWCLCQELQEIACPVRVDVLMHQQESWRPTSTGHLIKRVLPASALHLHRRERPIESAAVLQPGRTVWILHPRGEAVTEGVSNAALQVLLLDGTWRQAGEMVRTVQSWGRLVRVPCAGPSRYWLRSQLEEGHYCTVEALIFLLEALGLQEAHTVLRLQFELHVYAALCARGAKSKALEFLATSPVRAALGEKIARLTQQRRRELEA